MPIPDGAAVDVHGQAGLRVEFGFAVLAILAVAIGGGALAWQFSLLLIGSGLLLGLGRFRAIGPAIAIAAIAASLLPLIGFLPPSAFGPPPPWRVLVQDLGIPISERTITPQPFVTAEIALLSAFAVALIVAVPAIRWTPESRRRVLRFLTASVCGIAAVALAAEATHREIPFWLSSSAVSEGIGPFANRNAFGTLLAAFAPAALALAWDGIGRRRRLTGLFWLGGWLLLLIASVVNGSRGGILLFCVGTGGWILAATIRARSVKSAALAAAGLITVTLGIVWASPGIVDEVRSRIPGEATMTGDGRIPIYKDTWRAIQTAPLAGCGLGNFSAVFALQRQAVTSDNRVLHPESDWLWLAHEGGVPYALAFAILVGMVAHRAWSSAMPRMPPTEPEHGPANDWILGWAAASGVAVFLIHSLFDIPGHFPAVGLCVLLLVSASAIGSRAELADRGTSLRRPSSWAIRSCGAMMVLAGGAWLATALGAVPLMPAAAAKAVVRTVWAGEEEPESIAVESLEQAATTLPMDWRLHFLLGREGIRSGAFDVAARHFRAARVLAPEGRQVAIAEAREWKDADPARAIAALQTTAMEAPAMQGPLFQEALRIGTAHPDVLPFVEGFATMSPSLMAAFLRSGPTEGAFSRILDELLAASDALRTLDPDERRSVLDAWFRRGDTKSLLGFLEAHADELTDVREIEFHALVAAKEGEFAKACERGRAVLAARGIDGPQIQGDGDPKAEWQVVSKALRTSRRSAE